MSRTKSSILFALTTVAGASLSLAQTTGPSSSASPYVLPLPATANVVSTTSILTVGDTIGGYRLVGIPDGAGAFSNNDGTFTFVVNHELGQTSGVARAHGSTGSFVSRWVINAPSLSVVSGRDHNTAASDVLTWDNGAYVAGSSQFGRFCSADLAEPSAYLFGTVGSANRIFMNGEEIGSEGRAFAHVLTGPDANKTWQLPRLGKFSWENSVASPFPQASTVVIGTDDSTPGEVYVYVGTKTSTGLDIDKAGLTNGNLYGIRVAGLPTELRTAPASGRFDLYNHGDVSNITGTQIQNDDNANNVTKFLRPEDGAWDPRPGFEDDFYFLTTDRVDNASQVGRSRLYRLRFDDITNPTLGGTITELVSTLDGPQMMDNMCVDVYGRVLIQEDIGGNVALGKVWLYDLDTDKLVHIASHDANRFITGAPNFLTIDEESSGIIDASTILGAGWSLMVVQAHYGIPGELVEGGQVLAMYVNPIFPCAGDFNASGTLSVQDVFDFLAVYFGNDLAADVNGSGTITVQDIFDFLAAYFAGC